jgi:outer membrane protein assembly factor BamB
MLYSMLDTGKRSVGALACALVVVATGCTAGSGASDHPRQRGGEGSAATRPAQDPPTRFAERAIDLGAVYSDAYEAHGDVVYKFAAANELSAVELATGKTLWSRSLEPAARPPANAGVPDPVIVEAGGELAVTVVYLVTAPDSATGRARAVARVAAVAARDGRPLWSVEIADDAVDKGIPVLAPRVVAVAGTRIVVSSYMPVPNSGATDPRRHYTFVLDAATGQTRWSRAGFNAHTVSGSVVAGVDNVADAAASVANFSRTGPAQGRSLDDGALVWASDRAFAGRSGAVEPVPDVLVLEDESARGDLTVLLSASTGRILATVNAILMCRDDEGGVLVCSDLHAQPSLTTAFDIRSGRRLWTLPDPATNRPALDLIGAFHGAVYATTVRSGPLVLDAKTGKELVTTLAVTPDRVVPGYGLTFMDGELLAYPATG